MDRRNQAAGLLLEGKRHQKAGDLRRADACYRQALALDPDNPAALNLNAMLAHEVGRVDLALPMLQRAATLKPDDREAWANLALVLTATGREGQALSCHARIVRQWPDHVAGWRHYGDALLALGQLEGAREAFGRALALAPQDGENWRHLSRVRTFAAGDPELAQMEALLSSGRPGRESKGELCFALGKAYDDVGDDDRAFTYYLRGNISLRKGIRYHLSESASEFAALRKAFAPMLASCDPAAGCADNTPIFIVGMPRSGTTLVEQILASHPDVAGAGETQSLRRALGAAQGDASGVEFLRQDPLRAAGYYLTHLYRAVEHPAPRITDKMPDNFKFIAAIALMFPSASIIHCVRDPLDTCVSLFKARFSHLHPYAYDLAEIGGYYRLYQEMMEFWQAQLPGRMYEVRYEALVQDSETQVRALLAHCGLPWNARCLQFHASGRAVRTASDTQVRRPFYSSSVGSWKRYEKHLAPLRKALHLAEPALAPA